MSSTESSGAPAEATATTPAPDAAFPTFGTTRGSGLARGKRPAAGTTASTTASSEYTPTAIEVVNAPREYQNPFAPAEAPKAEAPAPTPVAETLPVIQPAAPSVASAKEGSASSIAPAREETPAELNILEPAQQKIAPAQTWESEGFKPAREPRGDRPRREERSERPADEPVDVASIPPQFLYVRPGHTYVPTPRNWGGAPRERTERPERSERPAHAHGSPERAMETSAELPAKSSGGFFGWLKSLFGGSSSETVSTSAGDSSASGEQRREGGGHRRHRGGRGRGPGGEGRGGRSRGGRGGRSGGYRSEGSSQGGV